MDADENKTQLCYLKVFFSNSYMSMCFPMTETSCCVNFGTTLSRAG